MFDAVSLQMQWQGFADRINEPAGRFQIKDSAGIILIEYLAPFEKFTDAIKDVIDWLKLNVDKYPITAIGYRVIQGGPMHCLPEVITPGLLALLQDEIYLAPNHLPDELSAVHAFTAAFNNATHIACYDTLFHKQIPNYAKSYPLPPGYEDKGLMRYGFHGLSYESVMEKLAYKISSIHHRKILIAHLGNGASMAAVKNGICIETTMGISPIGGLMMGTRSGDLDPGAIIFLLKQEKVTPDELEDLLSKNSGLKAIAGNSNVKDLLMIESKCSDAKKALAMFCYTAKKYIGSLVAAMGGMDILVFTGGIGENSAVIRERICEGMEFFGISLDQPSNYNGAEIISSASSRVQVWVMPTNEEWMIARHSKNIINNILK